MKIGTAPKYLLDTNVMLEAFHGEEPIASRVKSWIESGEIALSAVTVAEIVSKASVIEKEKLDLLVSRFGALAVDQVVAEIAGKYRKDFARKKKRVYLLACFIAATAKLYNLTLVTRNYKDFPMKDIKVLLPTSIS
ncbi:type II toxin-antitoxin system VapC family toxin [Candidatus Collierbacteria bacterium]|nr:type II toxin-antitoxin system VapC family toxin [Candidatus Collierbacteria bacterium]